MLKEYYGRDLFYRVAKQKTLISHVAMDIVQQDRLIRAQSDADIKELKHNRSQYHIIHVDSQGYYLGDWRSTDVDAVSKVQRGPEHVYAFLRKVHGFQFNGTFFREQLPTKNAKSASTFFSQQNFKITFISSIFLL